MDEYRLELEAIEAKLLRDPDNEELITLRNDIMELLEMEEDSQDTTTTTSQSSCSAATPGDNSKLESNSTEEHPKKSSISQEQIQRRLEKLKKKKLKRKEKLKEQHEIAEKEKQSWQSFTNKKGLKGAVKKSIFASPHSVTGKVGVGTNGIADAPSASTSSSVDSRFRRRAVVCEKESLDP